MQLVTDFLKHLVDFVRHLDMLHMIVGVVLALLCGVVTGTIIGLFIAPLVATVVYIAVDVALPMVLHHAAFVMPVFDKALLHEAITLYVAFFVVILVVFLIKKAIQAVTG